MEEEQILELFNQLTPEDQKIVIELMKISLSMSTIDLYKIIEEFERQSSGW